MTESAEKRSENRKRKEKRKREEEEGKINICFVARASINIYSADLKRPAAQDREKIADHAPT